MARYRHAYSRGTTLAGVDDTFRESIIITNVSVTLPVSACIKSSF